MKSKKSIKGEKKYFSAKKVAQEFSTYDEVYQYYYSMASVLKDYGFNFNLAPCVDVAVNKNSVLNQKYRIYSSDEKIVAQKASAFVTDEGGITCHAAIISREFGVPCIVGTICATKKIKDGDYIEVDAYKGEIRIIKESKG